MFYTDEFLNNVPTKTNANTPGQNTPGLEHTFFSAKKTQLDTFAELPKERVAGLAGAPP